MISSSSSPLFHSFDGAQIEFFSFIFVRFFSGDSSLFLISFSFHVIQFDLSLWSSCNSSYVMLLMILMIFRQKRIPFWSKLTQTKVDVGMGIRDEMWSMRSEVRYPQTSASSSAPFEKQKSFVIKTWNYKKKEKKKSEGALQKTS